MQVMISYRAILEADVRLAQLLHSMATKTMISKNIVAFCPTVCKLRVGNALHVRKEEGKRE